METKIFTRQQLYDKVWSEPLTAISKQFDISDIELRKICKNLRNSGISVSLYRKKIVITKCGKNKKHVVSYEITCFKMVSVVLSGQFSNHFLEDLRKLFEEDDGYYSF